MRLVLASSSPRRAELLRAAGFTFEIVPANVDERVRDGEAPAEYVRRLAAEKSAAVLARIDQGPPEGGHYGSSPPESGRHATAVVSGSSRTSSDLVVIGADTAVVVDDGILGKPIDDEDGARMLERLSGRTHEVLTGISVRSGGTESGGVESTRVTFADLSEAQIRWYVSSGEGRDKAGGYAIQGLASRFVTRIDGSYSNVVGLPVAALAQLLAGSLASGGEAGYPDRSHSRKFL
jgi:septum formation protein